MGLISGIKNLGVKAKTRDGYKFKYVEDAISYELLITYNVETANVEDKAIGFFKKSALRNLSEYFTDEKFIDILHQKLKKAAYEYLDLLRDTGANKQDMERKLSKYLTMSIKAIEDTIASEKERINKIESEKRARENAIKEYNESGSKIIESMIGKETQEPKNKQRGE